jgi:hypothetical protein
MPHSNFLAILNSWKGSEVTVVNPQSFRRGAITNAIDLETFPARIVQVGEDFVEVAYEAKKKGDLAPVTQYIPFSQIRRLSVWGSENLIHI